MQSFSPVFHLARRNLFQEVLWAYKASSHTGPQTDRKASVLQTNKPIHYSIVYMYPLMLHKSENAQTRKDFFAAKAH